MIAPQTMARELRDEAHNLRGRPRVLDDPPTLTTVEVHSGWEPDVRFDPRRGMGALVLFSPERRPASEVRFGLRDLQARSTAWPSWRPWHSTCRRRARGTRDERPGSPRDAEGALRGRRGDARRSQLVKIGATNGR
jgi:hypothetical protein